MKYVAKFAFNGNANQGQLSFPVDAVIVTDSQQAPRNGWMYGDFQGETGWFPASHVEPVMSASMPPTMAPPTAPAPLPEANIVVAGTGNQTLSASAPPVAAAIPVPDSYNPTNTPTVSSMTSVPLPPPVHKPLDERQISQLIQQGYTRGRIVLLS